MTRPTSGRESRRRTSVPRRRSRVQGGGGRAAGAREPARGVATIRDVAREAGVSVATVSRVFNGTASVKSSTDRDVRRAAKKLNYWPNGAARSLIMNRTLAVGMLLPDLHGEFFSEVIRGADLEARPGGYHLIVSSSHSKTDDLLGALRAMRGRIDGLIVMAPDIEATDAIRAGASGIPTVLLSSGRRVSGFHTISIDNTSGALEVVRHLIALGHRRIAMVTGPARNLDARQRFEAYERALDQAGIPLDPSLVFPGDFTEPSGYEAGRRIAAQQDRPTAVFVGNDKMAVGVLGGLSDSGVRVPDDIALAGFDDIEMAQYLNPSLTTVHADAFRLGQLAVTRLLEMLSNETAAPVGHEILETTLVVRGSCGGRTVAPGATRIHRSEIGNPRNGPAGSGGGGPTE